MTRDEQDRAADAALAEMVEALAPLCKCCPVCSPGICSGVAAGCERRCRCDDDDVGCDDEAEECDALRNGGRP